MRNTAAIDSGPTIGRGIPQIKTYIKVESGFIKAEIVEKCAVLPEVKYVGGIVHR